MTDLVWIVKPGDGNEELRWSLRSAVAHVPHERVWIVGSRPGWCTAPHVPPRRIVGYGYLAPVIIDDPPKRPRP